MAADRQLWHCPDAIDNHPLARSFRSSLSEISERDYPGKRYFTAHIPAIDLDSFESSQPGENSPTADAAIGICHECQGEPVNKRLLLVELRMGYNSTDNLSTRSIDDKERHSRYLLKSACDTIHADEALCLIFHPDIEQQAIQWLHRKQKTVPAARHWRAMSPESLCASINAGSPWPYTPSPESIAEEKRFLTAINSGDIAVIDSAFLRIREVINRNSLRYKTGECNYLAECLQRGLDALDSLAPDKDDAEYLGLITEDITNLIKRHRSP